MKNRVNQVYEKYWNYTAAFTDFEGKNFRHVLKICIAFIDGHGDEAYSSNKYNSLQHALQQEIPCNGKSLSASLTSQRKRVNQLVKLGFIEPYLSGYPPETIEFIKSRSAKRRKSVLSKIVYKYANLFSAVNPDENHCIDYGHQLSFFIKTLEEVGSFNDLQLATLMTIDIPVFIQQYGRNYATAEDLTRQYDTVDIEGFKTRKYNQIGHLRNLLGKLEDLCIHKGIIYFKSDADRLFADATSRKLVRDPYLQRVYKAELEDESCTHFGSKRPKCMLDGLAHPVLIASHIKPYSHCGNDEKARFDVNNGLLLNKALDSLFDLGYITFAADGTIITSNTLDVDLRNHLRRYALPADFVTAERMEYMAYHREFVFDRQYAKETVAGH